MMFRRIMTRLINWLNPPNAWTHYPLSSLEKKKRMAARRQKALAETKETRARWGKIFNWVDFYMKCADHPRLQETGYKNGDVGHFLRKIAPFIFFDDGEEDSFVVPHVSSLGLPAMFAGSRCDDVFSKADFKHSLQLICVSGILVDRPPKPMAQMKWTYACSMAYASPELKRKWGSRRRAQLMIGHFYMGVDETGCCHILDKHLPASFAHTGEKLQGYNADDLTATMAFVLTKFRERDSHWLVRVKGNTNATITIGIPPLSTPSLFNKRMKVQAPSGRSRPIFHPVRTHQRKHKTGRLSVVRLHHRGLRKFDYRSYECEIVIPSWRPERLHDAAAPIMNDFDIPSHDVSDEEYARSPNSYLNSAEVAAWLNAPSGTTAAEAKKRAASN